MEKARHTAGPFLFVVTSRKAQGARRKSQVASKSQVARQKDIVDSLNFTKANLAVALVLTPQRVVRTPSAFEASLMRCRPTMSHLFPLMSHLYDPRAFTLAMLIMINEP